MEKENQIKMHNASSYLNAQSDSSKKSIQSTSVLSNNLSACPAPTSGPLVIQRFPLLPFKHDSGKFAQWIVLIQLGMKNNALFSITSPLTLHFKIPLCIPLLLRQYPSVL